MAHERVVYVVDDDPAIRRSLERLLDAAGFRVVSYATPKRFSAPRATCPWAASCWIFACRRWTACEVQTRLL